MNVFLRMKAEKLPSHSLKWIKIGSYINSFQIYKCTYYKDNIKERFLLRKWLFKFIDFIQIQILIPTTNKVGARGVMVIVAGIGHGDTSSNLGLIAFHIGIGKGMNPIILPPAMGK